MKTHLYCLWSNFTGVLKDYLRELPSPLITKQLYEAVLDAMAKSPLKMSSSGCENEPSDSRLTVDLLDRLRGIGINGGHNCTTMQPWYRSVVHRGGASEERGF